MQRTSDARALEGLGGAEFLAQRHQARHFGFGNPDFGAPKFGKANIGDHIVMGGGGLGGHGGDTPEDFRLRAPLLVPECKRAALGQAPPLASGSVGGKYKEVFI